ncbi:MAG: efflux RND transporter periplasmic adaptor subunit [Psychromonas sp.]
MKYITLVVAIVTSLLLTGCDVANSKPLKEELTKPVRIEQYWTNPIETPFQFLGEVSSAKNTPLSFRLGGEITHIYVEMGQKVRQGDLIAELDKVDYQLAYQSKLAQYELSTAKKTRAERLYKQKLISKDSYEQSLATYQATKAELAQAKTDLSYTSIRAPFDGVISVRYVNPYQLVAPQQVILNLIDDSAFEVVVSVPVSTANKLIGKDYALSFELDSMPGIQFEAKLKEVTSQPERDTNSYVVNAEIFPRDEVLLLPGNSGKLLVNLPDSPPIHSQFFNKSWISVEKNSEQVNGTLWLFDEKTSRVSKRNVMIDSTTGEVEGIGDGDFIVSSGIDSLVEGQKVRAWKRERGI